MLATPRQTMSLGKPRTRERTPKSACRASVMEVCTIFEAKLQRLVLPLLHGHHLKRTQFIDRAKRLDAVLYVLDAQMRTEVDGVVPPEVHFARHVWIGNERLGRQVDIPRNARAVRVDEDLNIILVKGAVPGGKNGIVRVRMAGEGKSW